MNLYTNGKFRARAVAGSAQLGVAGTGTEQVAVQIELLEGPDKGAILPWYGFFTPAAEERTLESLHYLGFEGDNILDLSTVGGPDAPDVIAVLEDEEGSDGEVRTRVLWINKIGSGQLIKTQMAPDQQAAFAARMKGKLLAQRQKSGAPASSAASKPAPRKPARGSMPQHAPAHTDDDIPF